MAPPALERNGSSEEKVQSPTSTLYPTTSTDEEELEKVETHKDTSDLDEHVVARRTRSRPATGFEPVRPGDRAELHRLASEMSRLQSITSRGRPDLERTATLEGIEVGHPALDPQSDQFDVYKWAKFLVRTANEEGFTLRRAGVVWKNLNINGTGSALNLQKSVADVFTAPIHAKEYISFGSKPEKRILRDFDGIMKSGELLIVLGRPGSGCTTLLKTICGELYGLDQDKNSTLHYNGITQKQMLKEFKNDVVYNQETDKHFPHLTVGQTLTFASAARTPQNRLKGATRKEWSEHMAQVTAAIFGLSHTWNTKVGNDFIRGVSGGERKRVSIAEMAIAGAPIAAWDNSTRGLDAATALEFVKSLRLNADLAGSCHAVAIYQASQAIYDVFDKAVVLYEGREIFFGPTDEAEDYFHRMGWFNPPRQTTGDFLTSVTNPSERKAREGYEDKVPRTPEEFEKYWKSSPEYKSLMAEIDEHEKEFPVGGGDLAQQFHESKVVSQANHVRPRSTYMISPAMQVKLCMKRAYQRIWNDKPSTVTTIVGQIVMALIIGSIFYGTPNDTNGFFAKGSVLFFATLLNALISISEINSLYAQRPIVEKQKSYSFVHPAAEAFAGIVSDLPVKFIIAVCFNIILYFLAGLRYEPSQFFIYFLFLFTAVVTMSGMFRTLAAITKTASAAMALAGVMVLAIVIYTGFVVPRPNMHPWFSWITWINPVYYAFEALIANEFHGREFPCAPTALVPAYANTATDNFICAAVGAVQGQTTVSGDAFIEQNYEYSYSHVWRNFGIMLAFLIFFEVVYVVASELNSSTSSTAEFLVFRRGHVPKHLQNIDSTAGDAESGETANNGAVGSGSREDDSDDGAVNVIPAQKDVFTWRNVEYTIPVKGGKRKLLDGVSGWVKPGTLTALMGVSGAGKTTLLDVLAQRVSIGVVTGDMLVNGKSLDASFQRKTGYVQQQDLHLETSSVREALRFSALLRQPKTVSKQEKYDYVEQVIKMLKMEDFAEAIVGQPGEGLNVEQRKLLTIGVELAAKPALLLFLDEPTSGLDSQSSWAICAFLRKLADNGQAVLATIHQPSAILFQEFDRLLFLAKGGKTVYFGDIGKQSRVLLDYFESNGARKCEDAENPAEYMLEIIGAGSTGKATQDWPETWKKSEQAVGVQTELDRIHKEKESQAVAGDDQPGGHTEFAMPFTYQLWEVTYRVFQQYWRMPSYIIAKFLLGVVSALFIAFSFFKPDQTQQGFQDALFAVFMLTSIFSTLVQQIMPQFITQRSLYEVRERPSKAYSWKAFLIANIVVEMPYQIFLAILVWASWYYPIYTAGQSSERQGLMLLFAIQFFLFTCTFSHLVIAALPDAETGGQIATLAFSMTLTFNGVMQAPSNLPGFWIFMYRVSPLTYLVAGMSATGLGGREITCSSKELSVFSPPAGQTCGSYMEPYLQAAGGALYNPTATSNCQYCQLTSADTYLASREIYFDQRWRNFGIGWAYVGFNIFGAVFLYWLFRVNSGSFVKIFLPFEKIFKAMKKALKKGHKVF